jgi:hypothetical protein
MKTIVQSLFILALLTGLVSAATVNCTVVSSPTELNATIVCPQFNGVGLTSVDITVTGEITGSITLTNNGTSTQSTTGTTTSNFDVGALAGFTIANPIFMAMFTTGSQSLNGGQTETFSGLTSGTNTKDLGTDTTVLAPYTGAGTFDIGVSTLTSFSLIGGGGQIVGAQSTNADATATVTYTTSTSTPEPVTASLIGVGLCGLGLLARRKIRS